MSLHAISRVCHHPDGMVNFIDGVDNMRGHIVDIPKLPPNEPEADLNDGLVLDAHLLDRVFKLHITTVKNIPHNCHITFSHALKAALFKAVANPWSVEAWFTLIYVPTCML